MARPSVPIIECFNLESPLATEYRRLLQNLRKIDTPVELKSIMLTSSIVGEGKSTISSLLAITAAHKGQKTILVDCDVRRPAIHRLFQLERTRGLVEIISEGVSYKDVVRKTSLDNLDIITSGKVTAHPSELFNTALIDALFGELKFYYDLLIIDSPPVLPVSDPMLLSQSVDGVILVIKAGDTAREVAVRAVEIMRSNRANILGVVLNNARNRLPYYYDYSHYHYDYSQSGQSGETSSRRDREDKKSASRSDSDKGEVLPPPDKKRMTR
jgi:capsular exopolysaccharide synthesis family protein